MEARLPSLIVQTLIDILPEDRVVRRVDDHLVIRSPGNPTHWEGNVLVFDDAPRRGDGVRWETAFADAFADEPAVAHRSFSWEQPPDGAGGDARAELEALGYDLDREVGLVAAPSQLVPHPRANREIEIRRLDPAPGEDEALWDAMIAVALADNADGEQHDPVDFERFIRARQTERRALFTAGRGGWYVAIDRGDPDGPAVVAGCGIITTGARGRYQAVVTHGSHRRRGIARRLVHDAGIDAAARHRLDTLVIVAGADHHARGIYESLGFRARERRWAATRPPTAG